MSRIKSALVPVARTPTVRAIRRKVGRVGAPGLNPEFEAVRDELAAVRARVDRLEAARDRHDELLWRLEQHLPSVLNAIASTNGTARLLRREIDERFRELASLWDVIGDLKGDIQRMDRHVQDELWPLMSRAEGLEGLYQTAAWLTTRVETVRAELMHELRYGPRAQTPVAHEPIAAEIVNPDALASDGPPRLNLGCGHIPLDGYVNVDIRALPGVDVVAPVDALPFDPASVGEVFSAHMLEHFPQAQLERQLLPYWRSLLAPGGTFRAVVPDIEAMIDQYRDGTITWDNLREVTYGGQEYEGDFHHTAFTPDSLTALLSGAGFVDVELVERGRRNGDCLELEIVARRPEP